MENNEEASVFDDAEISEELPTEEDMTPEDEAQEDEEWTTSTVTESPKEALERKGKKEKADGRTLTIKEIGFTRPKMRDQGGNKIPPMKTQSGEAEFYPGKLRVKFEEDNLVEYYPSFKYFVNDKGKVNNLAKINRGGTNAITNLFKLAVKAMGQPEDEVSDQQVFDWLIGKKVVIKTSSGVWKGNAWFRNDIAKFV